MARRCFHELPASPRAPSLRFADAWLELGNAHMHGDDPDEAMPATPWRSTARAALMTPSTATARPSKC
ncbi:MAG: hypothetical protein ACK6AD_07460 [Cyanobacteriota bacterium]